MVLKTLSTLRLSKDQPVPGGVWGACVLAGRATRPPLSSFPKGSFFLLLRPFFPKPSEKTSNSKGGASQEWHSPLGGWEIMCRG